MSTFDCRCANLPAPWRSVSSGAAGAATMPVPGPATKAFASLSPTFAQLCSLVLLLRCQHRFQLVAVPQTKNDELDLFIGGLASRGANGLFIESPASHQITNSMPRGAISLYQWLHLLPVAGAERLELGFLALGELQLLRYALVHETSLREASAGF